MMVGGFTLHNDNSSSNEFHSCFGEILGRLSSLMSHLSLRCVVRYLRAGRPRLDDADLMVHLRTSI
jgi:hypothetical protein